MVMSGPTGSAGQTTSMSYYVPANASARNVYVKGQGITVSGCTLDVDRTQIVFASLN
jgi:hypothetical protein